jgi:hypothetical protein
MEVIDEEMLINPPYYDFVEAENFGCSLDDIAENNFNVFITNTFIIDLIKLRKSYIIRDFVEVRKVAHKFKGSFSYFILI